MGTQQALIYGSQTADIWVKPLGLFLDEQADRLQDHPALVVPWQDARLSYRQLADQSRVVASALLGVGLRHGDFVGVMAGNRYEYINVFLGAARIGCPVVVLNNTYTPEELKSAVRISCKSMTTFTQLGGLCMLISCLLKRARQSSLPQKSALEVSKNTSASSPTPTKHPTAYRSCNASFVWIQNNSNTLGLRFSDMGVSCPVPTILRPHNVNCKKLSPRCLRIMCSTFSSLRVRGLPGISDSTLTIVQGTTGAPKAAMLTHM